MRIVFVFSILLTGLFCLPALAAEQGAYRPARPYQTVPARSADICQSQCQGDAQCRSWNFVRLRSGQATGICEFLDKAVSPIASPISISGVSASAEARPDMSRSATARLISAGTNTVRVGNPASTITPAAAPAKPAPARQIQASYMTRRPASAPHQVTRQVTRPVTHQAQRPARRQLQAPLQTQSSRMAALQNPALTRQPYSAVPSQRSGIEAQRSVMEAPRPLFRPYLDGRAPPLARQDKYQDNHQGQQAPQVQPPQKRPPVQPAAPLAAIGGSSVPVLAPQTQPNQAKRNPASAKPVSSRAALQQTPASAAPINANLASASLAGGPLARMTGYNGQRQKKSLFGSLYDDVNGPVASPKVLGPQDIPDDLDAPIATVSAAPTIAVDVEPF